MMDTVAWDRALQLVARVRGDFLPGELVHETGKTLLVGGTVGGQPVVAKVLTDRDPFWREKFDREIGIYRAFACTALPVRVPRLVDADPAAGVLILERLTGRPLSAERYPDEPHPVRQLAMVVDAVASLGAWRPQAAALAGGWDYAERLDRYRRHGLLDDRDHQALTALLEQAGPQRRFAHGDALPGNIWLTGTTTQGRQVALLDWEFAGFYLPGFDLALLWVLLRDVPQARRLIATRIADDTPQAHAAFAVNQAMALTRELRIHRETEPSQWRDLRLAALTQDWATFRTDVLHPPGRR